MTWWRVASVMVTAGAPTLWGRLLRLAVDDEFAQQTVIQVILPGLLAMSRRAHYMVGASGGPWADHDDLEQEIVAIAYERIRALAGTTQAWPARTLLDQTWRRLRLLHDRDRQWKACWVPMDGGRDIPGSNDRSPVEELAQVVVDAVRTGSLAPGVAATLLHLPGAGLQHRLSRTHGGEGSGNGEPVGRTKRVPAQGPIVEPPLRGQHCPTEQHPGPRSPRALVVGRRVHHRR